MPRPATRAAGLKGALALFSAAHLSEHLCTSLLVPILPFIRDYFGLTYFQSGLILSAFSVSSGISNLPMGWLADRFGMRRIIALGLVGVALSTIAVGASPGYYVLFLVAVSLGLFAGAYHPVSAALLGGYSGERRRGRALGLHMVGGSIGVSLAPLLGGVLADTLGWRWAFYLLAIPCLAVAPFVLWLGRTYESRLVGTAGAQVPQGSPNVVSALRPVALVLGLSLGMGLIVMGATSLLPIYLVDARQISPAFAAALVSVIQGAGIVSAPLGGVLADRLGRRQTIAISLAAAGPLLYLVAAAPAGVGLVVAMLVLGGVTMLRQPAMQSLIVDVVPRGRSSSVLGLYFFLGAESRSVIVPFIGFSMDAVGLWPTFMGLGLMATVLSVITIVFRRRL
ncbi:MAG: MFS transporter [Chloroflexi bacterium]|nr:MFS transporter [Chloroflexota bacterium]